MSLPPEPVLLDADPTRLSQVFSNLLNNAAKFTESGGRLALTAERQDGEIAVTVRDNGIGIPPDMLPRVFDMFTQVDRSLERSQGGLGIGLTLVQRLVTLHGGSVTAESEGPGRGTEVVVRLPVLAGEEPSRPDSEPAPGSSAPLQNSTTVRTMAFLWAREPKPASAFWSRRSASPAATGWKG